MVPGVLEGSSGENFIADVADSAGKLTLALADVSGYFDQVQGRFSGKAEELSHLSEAVTTLARSNEEIARISTDTRDMAASGMAVRRDCLIS